jgi:tetratricopeptide (TPR) repeat protein
MGATASGQGQLAIESANKVAAASPREALAAVPILQGFLVVPYWAKVQFGRWGEILADKGPQHDTPFTRGAWRYARARALVATGQLTEAETELGQLKVIVEDPALKANVTFSNNTGYAILRIAPEIVAGELAAKRKDWDGAVLHLERAVRYEDSLIYQEPADWAEPVRQILGAVLLEAGRPDEAEAVYWQDLRNNAGNGWSLFGLLQALRAQKKDADAALVQQRFEKVWKDADVKLGASRIGS